MKNKSGIYQIRNIIDGKIYIGSAINIESRKGRHFKDLRNNKHQNILLQRAYNKYTVDNFLFEVLEFVENKEKLIEREQFYIDTLKPHYNICPKAGSSLGVKRTDEFKAIQSKNKSGRKLSTETKNKISIKNKGKIRTIENKEKISKTLKKYFKENGGVNTGKDFSEEWRKNIANGRMEYNKKFGSPNKGIKIPTETCIYCNRVLSVQNILMHHNEKCKLKTNESRCSI